MPNNALPYWVPVPDTKPRTFAELQARCNAWNRSYAVGTAVEYLPVAGERSGLIETKTRSTAMLHTDGRPVVYLYGIEGWVSLDHVRAKGKNA
jgi:hypothetical protein